MVINWFKKKLGITSLELEVKRLRELEHFTLADVADRLKESMIVLGGDYQTIDNDCIEIPSDKTGILVLGTKATIRNSLLKTRKTKTTTVVEELN